MKRNNLILGAVGIVATAALVIVAPWKSTDSEGAYTQESLSSLTPRTSADDARLWMEARYIDHETGERISEKKLRQIDNAVRKMAKSRSISFYEHGPDNIGGRTRAIQVDRLNNNVIWAGGVSGGLFKSENGANSWELVEAYDALASPYISSMAQFTNGTLFVATGSNQESWSGDGIWYTQDQGATWNSVPGTSSFGNITEIVAPAGGTTLWLTTGSGLRKWDFGATSLTSVTGAGSGACTALQCSDNGQIFIAAFGSNKTYVSTDYGNTWADKSGNGTGLIPFGAPRIEYAISHGLNSSGNYSLYAVRTNSNLMGMHVSHDNGNTWSQFVGASGTPSNLDIYRNQGGYNSIVTVTPQNPEKILIGGIDIWKWEQTSNNPPSGGFEKLSEWFLSPTSSKYVHADNHEMKWDGTKLFIGNDGGIGITYDPEEDYYPANRGYNVTQFYGIAFDKYGAVIGGAQDNGTLYNDHSLSTWNEYRELGGGDGGHCEISFFNPSVLFFSSQFNNIRRSGDRGESENEFFPELASFDEANVGEGGIHPFVTQMWLGEYYDLSSRDSVTYIPDRSYAAGATLMIPSLSTGDSMAYVTPVALTYDDTLEYNAGLSTTETAVINELNGQTVYLDLYTWGPLGVSGSGMNPPVIGDSLLVDFPSGQDTVVVDSVGTFTHFYGLNTSTSAVVDMGVDSVIYGFAWDTLRVQDPYQSWFLCRTSLNGGEIWGTRDALRLSKANPVWGVIARGVGSVSDLEFSRDLSYMYMTNGSGTVRRVDGLRDVYSSDADFAAAAFYDPGTPTGTSVTSFSAGGNCEGIAVNPSDPDDIVVFTGFSSNNIKRSLNGTAGSPSFTNVGTIAGANSPGTYDGIIDRNDPDILVVGTSHGVFVTENGGTSWTDASAGFRGTPVTHVRQSWRTWDEGNFRPGEIHVGTFGRGYWSSTSYLGVNDDYNYANESLDEFKTKLIAYPNPTSSNTTLSFQLENTSDVNIQVFNLAGRLVKTINKKNMGEGAQTIYIDGSELSSGTYIVKFRAGQQAETAKFIKM